MHRTWLFGFVFVFGCASGTSGNRESGGESAGGGRSVGGSTASGGATSSGGATASGGSKASGGSTASGGTVGQTGGSSSGGSPSGGSAGREVTPMACDQLPAAGTWQQITPPGAGPGASSIAVDPLHPGVVYTGTVAQENVWGGPGNGLWKSTDCGATWAHVDTGQNADKIEGGSLVYILISNSDSNLIYTNSLYGGLGLYKSTDAGVDWSDITPKGQGLPDFVMGEALDPKDDQHLLMTFHVDCSAPYASMCIGETSDGGTTWRVFNGPSELHGWAEQSGLFFLDRNRWLLGAPGTGLFYTPDGGATWQKKLGYPGCHGFGKLIHTGDKYFLPCWGGVAQSSNGIDWQTITGSPHAISLELAQDTLYASFVVDSSGQPFWSAPLSDTTKWTTVQTGHTFNDGAFELADDSTHHVLYVPSFHSGLWRVVTQ